MTPKEMIEVLEAFESGKTIRSRFRESGCWSPWRDDLEPVWDFRCYEYQLKPEPMVIWVNVYPNEPEMYAHHSEQEAKRNCRRVGKTIKFITADE